MHIYRDLPRAYVTTRWVAGDVAKALVDPPPKLHLVRKPRHAHPLAQRRIGPAAPARSYATSYTLLTRGRRCHSYLATTS
jgi:hypothetical protein